MREARWTLTAALCLTLSLVAPAAEAQEAHAGDVHVPAFNEYDPPSTLVVPAHPRTRARYPFVDVHNHQWRMGEGQDLSEVTAEMDQLNMAVMVNLSGRGGEQLKRAVLNARQNAPGRFVVFTNVSFDGFDDPDWTERTVRQIEEDVKNGAQGLKIYKNLGLTLTDAAGERIPVDHPRIDPVWAKCGELAIPVLIHTGEPAPFWRPKDAENERLQELMERPRRYRDPALYPPWDEIMGEQHAIFRKHPGTTFVNAHLGWMGNDLGRLGKLLDEMPNVYTEIGAVLAELGRQPRFAREFFLRHQDRVLFGKDSWNPSEYPVYFRVLETADEYFDYYRRRHAFWKMYGLDLPEEVLKKLYYKNALRILPGIDKSLFPE